METKSSRSKRTISLFAVILLVLSAIGVLLPLGISGDNGDEETTISGFVVDDANKGVAGATVYLYNVHTGEEDSYLVGDDGSFIFTGYYGYFYLEAEPEAVESPLEVAYLTTNKSRTDIFIVERGDNDYGPHFPINGEDSLLILKKVPPQLRKTYYVEGYIKNEVGTSLGGATVTLKCTEFPGLEVSMTTNWTSKWGGHYNLTAFDSDYELWATAEGYNYNITNIKLNMTHRDNNITLSDDEYFISGLVLGGKKDMDVYLFDVNNPDEYIYERTTNLFNIKIYPGSYILLVDATGYKPYIYDSDIDIVDSGHNIGDITLKSNPDEMLHTEISFTDNDWNEAIHKTTWTLNSDSELFGLEWAGVGGPRFQIDKQFGNGDLNVDNSELVEFNQWLKSNGPYRLYTEDYFEVNNSYYNPTLKSFKSTPSGFGGSIITGQGTMKIVTEMSYTHVDGLEGGPYTVIVDEFRMNEKVTITFPDDFEVTSTHDEDILTMPNYHKVAINYTDESLTIKLSQIEGPIADIGYEPDDYVTTLENVSFDAGNSNDPTGKIVDYTWDFDDGNFANTEEASHNWTVSGIKNVTLTVRDSSDLEDMAYKLITVDDTKPTPKIEFENETGVKITEADEDLQVTFNASKSKDTIDGTIEGEIVKYVWDFDDIESGQSNMKIAVHTYKKPGLYDVSLNVTDAAGNYKVTNMDLNILDTTRPTPDMTPNSGQIEVGKNFTISAEGTFDNFDDLDNLTFNWDLDINSDKDGDGIKDNDYEDRYKDMAVINYSTPDYHDPITVLVNVTDSAGNFRNISGYFTVKGIDLKIQEGDLRIRPADEIEVGKKVRIEVNITNKGVAAENITVTLYVDGSVKGTEFIDRIEEDSSAVVKFTWKAKGEGKTHTIRVNVTLDNGEAEEYWIDNEREHKIKVVGGEIDPLCYVVVIVVIIIVVAILIYRKRTFGTFGLRKTDKGRKGKDKKKDKDKGKGKGKSKTKSKKGKK